VADPFLAEIRIFPFNFAPIGWAFCNGQILSLSQNTALFSLLGTTYGGNGTYNFALPNMQGNAPMHPGQGPGLSLHDLGETGGSSTVSLIESQIPAHTHGVLASTINSQTISPIGTATGRGNPTPIYTGTFSGVNMASNALSVSGGSQPHNNMMPYLTLNFSIAMQGVFPPRS
jgi:microcystin-dependent protein